MKTQGAEKLSLFEKSGRQNLNWQASGQVEVRKLGQSDVTGARKTG